MNQTSTASKGHYGVDVSPTIPNFYPKDRPRLTVGDELPHQTRPKLKIITISPYYWLNYLQPVEIETEIGVFSGDVSYLRGAKAYARSPVDLRYAFFA